MPPVVRVVAPGRDRRIARPLADLPVTLEAHDDHGLRDLHLRFTRVSGSGESLTFVDRDVPARIAATSPGQWTATAVLPLAALGLEDGDLIVYRGVASDARPGSPGVESDAFIVDIGPLRSESAVGGGGEDVDPEQRQAISQQMVIVKTERLHARGSRLSPEDRLSEAQGLAIEQRMVRAEFVFLMGGEVEDEVEEAAQAHDLVEGRLANQGQAALLAATRAMSRAEARLTAGDTTTALVAEREALRFLQQAFDRRRFLLRPVAERARIDPARRLQGPAPPAQPRPLPVAAPERAGGWDAVERAAAALARAKAEPTLDLVATAAGVAALDPADRAHDRRRDGDGARLDSGGAGRGAGRGAAAGPCRRGATSGAGGERRGRLPDLGAGGRRLATGAAMIWLRVAAWAIAIAAVVDPGFEGRVEPPVVVGLNVAAARRSPAIEHLVQRLSDRFTPLALIAREPAQSEGPWCVDVDVCVVVTDGTAALGGRPMGAVHVVHVVPPAATQLIAARSPAGELTAVNEVRVALAGGQPGDRRRRGGRGRRHRGRPAHAYTHGSGDRR